MLLRRIWFSTSAFAFFVQGICLFCRWRPGLDVANLCDVPFGDCWEGEAASINFVGGKEHEELLFMLDEADVWPLSTIHDAFEASCEDGGEIIV